MRKLDKKNIEDIFALTPMQDGMLYHYLKKPESSLYFEQLSLNISGEIDPALFERAWNRVIERNEMLRAIFRWETLEKPVQVILKEHKLQPVYHDFSDKGIDKKKECIERVKVEDREEKFDLRKVPYRLTLCKVDDDNHVMIISYYHILYDGWSTGIILQEFLHIYNDLLRGRRPDVPGKTKFKEFIKWSQSQDTLGQDSYWQSYLKGFDTRTPLPIKENQKGTASPPYTSSKNERGNGIKRFMCRFPGAFKRKIGDFVKNKGITLASLLYTAWGILLQKYTDSRDVVFGTTVAGRNAKIKDVEHIVGLFINTVPLRVQRKADTVVSDLLEQIHHSLQVREEYENTSLTDIKKNSELEGKEELFDTILVIENYPLERALSLTDQGNSCPISIDSYSAFYMTNYDLTVAVDTFDSIGVTFTYFRQLFNEPVIKRLMGHFEEILKEVVRKTDQTVGRIDMLTPAEKEQILEVFNRHTGEYSIDKTIYQLFENQVERTPEHTAVIEQGAHRRVNSYRELNEKSNRLARFLQKKGVTTETVVGIMMAPSSDMVVSLLAILKAGGAYLPVDPGMPADRIRFMLEDAGAAALLSHSRTVKDLPVTVLQNFEKKHIQPTVTPPRGHIKDFDALPMPDRSLINLKNYKNKIGMASVTDCISMQTTRGCPFECLYCHKIWSKFHVFRSAENIFNEVEYYYKKGITNFAFIDDCFNLNRENSSRLFRLITRNKLKVQLFFPNGLRGDIMTPAYIDLMVEAGTRGINLSLETASPRLQKLLKKNLDLDKFKKVVDYIAGQHPDVILEMATMHGFPGETEEEALMTLDFIKDIKWLHFPYIHILKIFPNTEMEAFALDHGISKEDILISRDRAFHELPETLPFPKSFTRKYQSNFMNDYFLNKERLLHVLPVQARILSEDALAQKYNAYLPVEIKNLRDIIEFAGLGTTFSNIESIESNTASLSNSGGVCPHTDIFDRNPVVREPKARARRILLLDLSQHFSSHHMLYKVAEQPLGLIYLLTYLKEKFPDAIDGRIYKSGIDFDSFAELRKIVFDYNPHLVGIRTLTFFKEFFHETAALLRQWGLTVPIITGGPYASSDFNTILKDRNVDLVVLGEGEETLAELIRAMLENNFKIPSPQVLKRIRGIAYENPRNWEETKVFSGVRDTTQVEVLQLDHLEEEIRADQDANLEPRTNAHNLAYVMYTSGSTGMPKGVMVEHRQVNNCISWMQDTFHLGENDTVVQRTALTFDPSVWEIFWPLVVGGKVEMLTAEQRKDADYLIRLMENAAANRLTMMYCPASLVKAMTWVLNARAEKPHLDMPWLIIGAEPIKMEVVKNLYKYYGGRIVNTYGPTECTINNTWYDLDPHDRRPVVLIGKPVSNNRIFILSKDLQPMPIRVAGEICIAGNSVSRGYINKPGLTSEKFANTKLQITNKHEKNDDFTTKVTVNPESAEICAAIPSHHSSFITHHSALLYKTGDIGRWVEDGNIEILGRVDHQVKIRGYRIELGEIESALLAHSAVKDCVAVVRNSKEAGQQTKTCRICGITSLYPGANIKDGGACEMCTHFEQYKKSTAAYFKTPADLEKLIREENKAKKNPYDCLLLYAGGRGSAYALYQLVDMGFKVLAVTYDNGYFSRADIRNIKKITAGAAVDHEVFTHKNSGQILKESLKVAHTVCRGCFHTASSLAVEYAYRHHIPVVVGATLSRGQIIENKLYLFLKQGITDVGQLEQEVTKLQRSGPVMDKAIFDHIGIDAVQDGTVHEHVTTVDFYRYFDITNQEMIAYLNSRDPYWRTRKTYSIYSTNCPIKQIGDYAHLRERGFHFYGSATSWEKRLGHLDLENVKEDLTIRVSARGYENFLKRIGYQKEKPVEQDEKYICAYIVFKNEKEPSVSVLREYLGGKIPDYMIPSYFVPLPAIPLTPVGKVDGKALPLPDRSRSRLKSTYVAPRGGLEKTIAGVWQEVLKVDKVGLEDNFFDLGGNSLDIVQVSGRLKAVLSREVPVVTIFTFPSVALLARHLKQEKKDKGPGESPVKENQGHRYQEREKGKERLKQRIKKRVTIGDN